MGDLAMTLPVILGFLKTYRQFQVTVLTKPFFAPLFTDLERVEVKLIDPKKSHKGIIGLVRLYRELKKEDYFAVADLHNVLRTNILKRLFQSGSTQIQQIDKGRKQKKALTRASNKIFKPLKTTIERYMDVFLELGYPIDPKNLSTLNRKPIPALEEINNSEGKKWLGIAPFAAHEGKIYPLHLMERVISSLNEHKNLSIFLFGGGKSEADWCNQMAMKYEHTLSMVGKLPFKEELALISNLDAMLSMDSGNGHLSAMYGVPTITLWGVTHPYAGFAPYGQPENHQMISDRQKFPLIPTSVYGNKAPLEYTKAMETIAFDEVVKKVVVLLENGG